MSMTVSKTGIDLITKWEGFSPKACKCVPTEKYYTIGYGHYGADVKAGQTITKAEAQQLLAKDLKGFERKVNEYADIYKFNQNEFDALVSFCYNVGNIKQLTNDGKRNRIQIIEAWPLYNKSGGKVLLGLTRRRADELKLFKKAAPVQKVKPSKTVEELAQEVIRGKWGNGSARKKALTAAGYNYVAVQARVNELMKGV